MEAPYPRDTREQLIGVLTPLTPTPSIDGPVFTSIAWVLWALALIMVMARVVDTRKRRQTFGIEAWFSIGSFVALSLTLAFAMVAFTEGRRYLITFVIPGEKGKSRRDYAHKIFQISSTLFIIFYPITLWVSKAAILFASRILIRKLSHYNPVFWIIAVFQAASFIVFLTLFFVPDNSPIVWTTFEYPYLQERRYTIKIIYIVQTVLDVATDLSAMILPCWLIPGLQLASWKKIMALVVFSLGLLVIIFSILRIVVAIRAFDAQFPAVQASVQVLTWSLLQIAMSSIIANAPALRNLVQYQLNRLQRKRAAKKNSKGKSSQASQVTSKMASTQDLALRRKRDSFEGLEAGLVSPDNNGAQHFERVDEVGFVQNSTLPNEGGADVEMELIPRVRQIAPWSPSACNESWRPYSDQTLYADRTSPLRESADERMAAGEEYETLPNSTPGVRGHETGY